MNRLIAIIGGDARYLELIKQLQMLEETTIILVGYDKLDQGFTGLKQVDFNELELDTLDAIILPITGTDSDGNIATVFSDQQIKLTHEWFRNLKKSVKVFTGITNDFLNEVTKEENIDFISLFDRDDVAIYNSIPTAEGAVMMAIEHTDYTIHSSRVIVSGFGRVGQTVVNKFAALGAKVSVSTNSIRELARITEMGLKPIPIEKLHEHTNRCDILINTVPALIIDEKVIGELPPNGIIIDLASKPGGTDFEYAKKRGIQAILTGSLPGIVAPKTSGRILADVIKQILLGEGDKS
ncbi:dipicolinic acid synthetase subunit A [Oceanobacillus bengalensis]|uniref:Dipicolinic acid synthetase subunit A n=1 Tax=Oceanobacillus bengalensis TaxID=1435466 RepID=A0A494Z459_9BACI|nr:dipicolinic acid synthetase subunit A [Oceanobacillus bengalensis]RKQ17324.1 dipicolinic acid synthetase subunit A [Oceanobacillus bengalensis]